MSGWLANGLALSAITYLAYVVYVTVRVVRSSFYSTKQKSAQVALTLLVPVLGVLLVHNVLRSDAELPKQLDKDFISVDEYRSF